jgi:hypothetical protein
LVHFTVIWYLYVMVIWYILRSFGIFYGHLVYFKGVWYILWPFGIVYGHLVYFSGLVWCTNKDLATLNW